MPGLDRSVTLAVKVTPADAEAIKHAAAKGEMSVSEFMRAATLMMLVLDGNAHAMKMLGRGALRLTVGVWERIRGVVGGLEGYKTAVARQGRGD
jgi:mobilization protein NikA